MARLASDAAFCALLRSGVTRPANTLLSGMLVASTLAVADLSAQPVRAPAYAVVQVEGFDCGVAALATVLTLQGGREVMPGALTKVLALTDTQRATVRERGYSLHELAEMARAAGADATVQRLGAQSLEQLPLPGLVHLSLPTGPHFSVVTEVVGDRVALADPSRGFMVWPKAHFLAAWAPSGAGYTLTVTVDPDASA